MQRCRLFRRALLAACALLLFASASPAAALNKFLGKTAEEWAGKLTAGDAKVRRTAAFALGKFGKNAGASLNDLSNVLNTDKDMEVREAAAFAIGEICRDMKKGGFGIPSANALRGVLTNNLSSGPPLLRRSCAFALGCMGKDAVNSQAALAAAAKNGNAAVRQNAAWALGKLGPSSVLALQNILQKERDPFVVRDAARALTEIAKNGGKTEAGAAVSQLARFCAGRGAPKGAYDEMRKAVLLAMVSLADRSNAAAAVGGLNQALNDPIFECKLNAALALGNIGGSSAIPAARILKNIVADTKADVSVRSQAASGLGSIAGSNKDNEGALVKSVQGPMVQAIPALKQALRARGPKGASADVQKVYAEFRRNSAIALGNIGPDANTAQGALVDRVVDKSENPDVRKYSAIALRDIQQLLSDPDANRLITVLKDQSADPELRALTLWPIRLYGNELLKQKAGLLGALEYIVANEPKTNLKTKMLRYDSAALLGFCKEGDVSDPAMKTLEEFLKDPNVKIFKGTGTKTDGGTVEGPKGGTGAKKVGYGDGRRIAVVAISYIGAAKTKQYGTIVSKLKELARSAKDEDLKKTCAQVVTDLGL